MASDDNTIIGLSTLFTILIIFLSYCIISSLLLRFGGRLHRKLRAPPHIMHHSRLVAHRGFKNDKIPENTLHAFRTAANVVKVDMVELDCWLSKDGEVVVFHDGTYDRVCGVTGHVNDDDYSNFPPIKLTPEQQTHHDNMLTEKERLDATRIPLLKEVLSMLDESTALIVEIKQDSDEMISKIYDLLEGCGRATGGKTVWFSLKKGINRKLQKFRKGGRGLSTISSITEGLEVFLLYVPVSKASELSNW